MTPIRPSRIGGDKSHDNLAAIRGERVLVSFSYQQTQRCLVRGIRTDDGFAQDLCGQRPEFTRALNARAIMGNRVPDINSPEDFPNCFWHPDIPAEQTLRDLLERYPSIQILALQLACKNGHEDVVLHLLKCKAKINPNRDKPLLAAMKHNHESIVRLLVARGADINAYSSSGAVLQVAAYRGLTSLAKIFIEKGADVNSERGVSCSAIFLASFAENKDIVEMLIKENADVNGESNDGSHYTKSYNIGWPLHAAALHGHEDITRILIRNGTSVNKIEGRYSTPLLAASINGHEKNCPDSP